MDSLRAWVSSHPDLLGYSALIVGGVLLVARLKSVVRSVKTPVRVPASIFGYLMWTRARAADNGTAPNQQGQMAP